MKSNKLLILPVVFTTITLLTGTVLSTTLTYADGNTDVVDELDITVNSACTMKGGPNGTDDSGSSTYTTTINAGNYTELSGSKLVTLCNDPAGYAIYAIGYSGDSYDSQTHTDLIGTETTGNIQTGTSGNNSYWAMKLQAVEGLTPPSIVTDFQNYHVIPDTYTKVASYTTPTATASDAGSTVQTKYKINISKTQLAGAYNGKVKYTMVHPNTAPAPTPPAPYETCDTPVPNLTYMQDLNSSNKATVLANMQEDEQYFLKDKRDEKSYCVAKLKDGNIWMTQNLDHDIKTDGSVAYTPATTDVPETWTPSTATYPTGTTTWNDSNTTPESYDPGTLYMSSSYINGVPLAEAYIESCMNGTCDQSIYEQLPSDWIPFVDSCNGTFEQCDMSLMPPTTTSIDSQHNHLGNYYNWTAAVAMNDSSSYTTEYRDVNQSICPANWTLPKGSNVTTGGSFQYLITQYGWDSSSQMMTNPNIWNSPIKTSLSGFWYGSLEDVVGGGNFWSPMVIGSDGSYSLYAGSDGLVAPNGYGNRGRGYSMRCLAR